ncbi:MAG: nucleoside deaminase [Actinobacteria bacterium]|nr:nucleoside deaminase [Actinomycetota bacterium]
MIRDIVIEKLNEEYMRLAIEQARKNIKNLDGGPFGACIVKGSEVMSAARNTVLIKDATSHAEINVIRAASRKMKSFDLSGCVIYSTTEPCPMCFSAIHWARIDVIVYGTTIADVKKLGFNELTISNEKMRDLGKSNIKIVPGFLLKECASLLEEWDSLENKVFY